MIIGDALIELPEFTLDINSIYYVCFLFACFILCRPFKSFLRPYLVFIFNFLFIYIFSLKALIIIVLEALISYLLSFIIKKDKIYTLFISIAPIILTIAFYKFLNIKGILLPLGLSYYGFKIISYLVDVYKEKIVLEKNIIYYFDYVCFFPCLTAGPVNKAESFLKELRNPSEFDYKYSKSGGFLVVLGIFEKLVFCDYLSYVNSLINSNPELSGLNILLGIILYSFEIYLNFDAISNIAIGSGRVLGFDLGKNFKAPYLASSLKDFWGRWHISLSTWLKDYIYIPLGGNRKGNLRKYLNIIIVFLISGIWHGVGLSFVVWGLLNALFEIIEDLVCRPFKDKKYLKLLKPLFIIKNFIVVSFLWMVFKGYSFNEIFNIIRLVFIKQSLDYTLIGLTYNEFVWLWIILLVTIIVDILRNYFEVTLIFNKLPLVLRWFIYIVLVIVFMVFGVYGGSFEASDFIYKFF